jgi:hypothetical protein
MKGEGDMPVAQRPNRQFVTWQSWRRGLGRVLPLALVLLLAACGVTTTTGLQPGGALNATTTATSAATPGGTPVSSVPPTDAVVLSIDHTSYTPSSTINVTLINHRATSIFTFDHQTSCTILTLQRQTPSGWEATGGCALGRMTQQVEIKAGATMQIALAPGAGQMHVTPWPAGTYRVILNYALQAQNMSATTPVASAMFAIG